MLGKFQDKALFHEKDYYKEVSIPKLLTQRLMASGGVFLPPPVAWFFREKFRQIVCIWSFGHVIKILLAIFKKNCKPS